MFHIYSTQRTSSNINKPNFIFDNKNLVQLAVVTLKHLYPYNPTRDEFIDAIESVTPSNFTLDMINKVIAKIAKDNEYIGIVIDNGLTFVDTINNYRYTLKVAPKKFNTRSYINRCKVAIINKCRYLLSFDSSDTIVVLPKVIYESIPAEYTSEALSEEDKITLYNQAIDDLCKEGWLRKTGLGEQIEIIR